jgi:hypothetical protein
VFIACCNNQFFITNQDTSYCVIVWEHVMIDNGCNTLLLPFPQDDRIKILSQFEMVKYAWEVVWSSSNGAIQCPVLKIFPSVGKKKRILF